MEDGSETFVLTKCHDDELQTETLVLNREEKNAGKMLGTHIR